jgi:hypothetical protein
VISSDRQRFSVATVVDVDDSPVFPPPDVMFFDAQRDCALFVKYLELVKTFKPSAVTMSLLKIANVLNGVALGGRFPITLMICQTPIDDPESFQRFASAHAIRPAVHFEIFALRPPRSAVDFSPLSDLAIFMNSKVHVCDLSQINVLPNEMVRSLLAFKPIDLVIIAVFSPAFKIVDILGSGVRRSVKSFALNSMAPGDTAYFYFDYQAETIKEGATSVQFQVRYFDALGRKIMRIMNHKFAVVDSMYTCALNVNYDMYIAAVVVRAVEHARELMGMDAVRASIRRSRVELLDDPFVKLLLLNVEKLAMDQVREVLMNGRRLLTRRALADVMGRCPADIVSFLAPVAYAFGLTSTAMVGPFIINRRPIQGGAYYVLLPGKRGVVLLGNTEDVDVWAGAVNESPIADLIATVCREDTVEIIAPSTSAGHPWYIHIMKCFESE